MPDKLQTELVKRAIARDSKSKIQRDPAMEMHERHPWLMGAADMLTGGATNPNAELGPVDLMLAALPMVGSAGKLVGKLGRATEEIPMAAKAAAPMMNPAQPAADMLTNQRGLDWMHREFDANRPIMERMEKAGLFSGDRNIKPASDEFVRPESGPFSAKGVETLKAMQAKFDPSLKLLGESLKPKAGYEGLMKQPKPDGVLFQLLERAGVKQATGEPLSSIEDALLKHYTSLIR